MPLTQADKTCCVVSSCLVSRKLCSAVCRSVNLNKFPHLPCTPLHCSIKHCKYFHSMGIFLSFFCCCWFLFLLKLARLRVRGDNVVENMPAENENKDLAHNFLHKEFSLRVTMLGSLACRTSSTRLLLSSYSSLYFNNHDSIPSSNLSKHLVV